MGFARRLCLLSPLLEKVGRRRHPPFRAAGDSRPIQYIVVLFANIIPLVGGGVPDATQRIDPTLSQIRRLIMEITWHGHACFSIRSGDYTVVLDPYDGVPGYPDGTAGPVQSRTL